jgi:hypothetical protein
MDEQEYVFGKGREQENCELHEPGPAKSKLCDAVSSSSVLSIVGTPMDFFLKNNLDSVFARDHVVACTRFSHFDSPMTEQLASHSIHPFAVD